MSFMFTVVCDSEDGVVGADIQAKIRAIGERYNLKPTRTSTAGLRWLLVGQLEDYGAFLTAISKENIRIVEAVTAY